jgi:O-antigen/teichoic acid export membrane protein
VTAEADGLGGSVSATAARTGSSWPAVRRLGRRLGWGLADQAVSSLTNFAMSFYIARSLGATQFGAFSLAYVTYSFALNASRGLATDPLLVRFSGADLASWRRAVASCTGTALAVGLITGGAALVAAFLLSGTTRLGFIALGLTLPGLMLQDSWRYSFFALGRGSRAFLNDLTWAVALIPGIVVLRMTGHETVFWFVLVWGAAAAVGAAVGPLQARVLPQISEARRWVSHHRDLGLRYLGENAANSSASQLRIYSVGLILGLAAVGYVQASLMLMGPFLVVFMGISLVTVPEAARVLQNSPRHLRLFCLGVGFALALAAVGWGAALLILLPKGLGNWLLGAMWRPTYGLILWSTLAVVGPCFTAGATAGLHALGMARRSLRAMVIASAAFVIGSVVGAEFGGAVGTLRGTAVATAIGACLWWWQLRVGLREAGLLVGHTRAGARQPVSRHRSAAPAHAERRRTSTAPWHRHSGLAWLAAQDGIQPWLPEPDPAVAKAMLDARKHELHTDSNTRGSPALYNSDFDGSLWPE